MGKFVFFVGGMTRSMFDLRENTGHSDELSCWIVSGIMKEGEVFCCGENVFLYYIHFNAFVGRDCFWNWNDVEKPKYKIFRKYKVLSMWTLFRSIQMSISITYNLTPYRNVLCVISCHRHLIWFSYKFKYEFIPADVWYNPAGIDSRVAVDQTSMRYACVRSMANRRRVVGGLCHLEISEPTFCCCVEPWCIL